MARSALWLLAAIMLIGASAAGAGENGHTEYVPWSPTMNGVPPYAENGPKTGPLLPPPGIRYGCQRVWRCDKTVCEWRRGCWGVYGYVEGPYYTSEFARRQWESQNIGIIPPKPRARKQSAKPDRARPADR
jgi:hypothetical protein